MKISKKKLLIPIFSMVFFLIANFCSATETKSITFSPNNAASISVDTQNTWALAHDATTGNIRTGTTYYVQARYTATKYNIERVFLNFDLSNLPENAEITRATINLRLYTSSGTTASTNYTLTNSTAQDTIIANDLDQYGNNILSDIKYFSGLTGNTYDNSFILNDAGIAELKTDGTISKFAFRNYNFDVLNQSPTIADYIAIYDPRLIIEYTTPMNEHFNLYWLMFKLLSGGLIIILLARRKK